MKYKNNMLKSGLPFGKPLFAFLISQPASLCFYIHYSDDQR